MNIKNNNLCAVILSGGLSSRMGGGIKIFEKFNNKTILDRIIERIEPQTKNIIISSNQYDSKFDNINLTIIADRIKGHLGPLAGIHSALYWIKVNMPEIEWLVSVPSDTPFLPKDLVKKLLIKAKTNNKKIILAKSNNRIHPVIGLWKSDLIEDLEKNLKTGIRKIMLWAELHPFETQNFKSDSFDPFFNINFKKNLLEAKIIEDRFIDKVLK